MFKKLWSQPGNGPAGKIDVPAVGLLIAEITSWFLDRREKEEGEPGDAEETFNFRASFESIQEWLFNDESLDHRIVIEIGRGEQYRLEAVDDARTVLDGRSLLIEGVRLCRL